MAEAFNEIHRMVLGVAFLSFLLAVMLVLFDKQRKDMLNANNNEQEYCFTEDSSEPYQTHIDPKCNSSIGKTSEINGSFLQVYRNQSFHLTTLEDDDEKGADFDKVFKNAAHQSDNEFFGIPVPKQNSDVQKTVRQ